MKSYFSNPENRHKRSLAMKGQCTSVDRFLCLSNSWTYDSDLKLTIQILRVSCLFSGIKFYCSNCGCEGHRRHYCPEILDDQTDQRFRCRLCGEKGHNRRTCWKAKSDGQKTPVSRNHHCRICGQSQHNSRTCPQRKIAEPSIVAVSKVSSITKKRIYICSLCKERGHNKSTCPLRNRWF